MSEDRDKNKFNVRMPEGMRDRIAELAKANNRSMNAEIVARLEASLQTPNQSGSAFFGSTVTVEGVAERIVERLKAEPGTFKITGGDAKLTVRRKNLND